MRKYDFSYQSEIFFLYLFHPFCLIAALVLKLWFFFAKFINGLKIFSREWLFTTNHKKLGLNYIIFAAFSGLFGTLLSTAIRVELSQPGSLLFNNNSNSYHTVVGMHAIIMVFYLVTPLVFGGFGNYFLPIQVGARDVAYPRLNNFSLWLLPAALLTAVRTLWEGIKVSAPLINTERAFDPLKWKTNLSDGSLYYSYNLDTKSTYDFNSYSFKSEVKNQIELNTLMDERVEGNRGDCSNLPLSADDLNSFLPLVNKTASLKSTLAGWTFTTPFSQSRFTGTPVDWALAALLIATLSSILTLINLIVTWRFLRGRGSRYQKDFFPILLIAVILAIRLLILVSPILTAGLLMLIADRHFSTSFFTVRAGGDVLLFQHLFWFFGHPEVYILIMPAFGITSTIIPYYVRKPLGSKMHMVYAMHAISAMGMVVWGHHMYLVGIDHKARIMFFVVTVMIALPASVKVCGWVAALINSTTFTSIELLFAITFVGFFIIGGVSGSICANAATDIILHDTYYIVGHFHIMLSGALMAMLMAYIYFNLREFIGVYYSWYLSFLHLVLHALGHVFTFIPMLWLGYAGMPRRIQDYPWGYAGWHSVASMGHVIVLASIICFISSIAISVYVKKPATSRNNGLPFVSTRAAFLMNDRQYARSAILSNDVTGKKLVRAYILNNCNNDII